MDDESIKYERNVAMQGGCRYMKTLSGSVNVEVEREPYFEKEGHTVELILNILDKSSTKLSTGSSSVKTMSKLGTSFHIQN